jgi:uncharacterized protein (DUF952 family)
MRGMRIFHIATLADWKQAQATGTYTTSTYGRSLREEGFIHASRREQVRTVRDSFYSDVDEPLLVLEIETDLLDVPWREDQVGDEAFPHIYGPLNTSAVVGWRPARPPVFEQAPERPPAPPVTQAFLGLAFVLAAAVIALFVAAEIAQNEVDQDRLPTSVPFLLWTLALTVMVAAGACLAYAELVRRSPRQ